MKYDDVLWHMGADCPDLTAPAVATHIGMFAAWAMQAGLAGERHMEEPFEALAALRTRSLTPGAFLLRYCDGMLTDDDLSAMGNAFAASYLRSRRFVADYRELLVRAPAGFHDIPDSWTVFDQLQPRLDWRFHEWHASTGPHALDEAPRETAHPTEDGPAPADLDAWA